MYVQGHDPLTFSFLSSFLFFDWVGVLRPQLSKVLKLVHWASSVPFPPVSLTEAGCLFAVVACVHVFISGDLQLQQQVPVLGPALAAWPAKPSNMKDRSMQVLVQQLVPSMVPEREKCDPPLWAG